MVAKNTLSTSPPYAVESALKQLGANLKTARLRRNLTLEDVSGKIGAGVRAIADAEKGKPTTGIAVYVGLLWAYDLLGPMADLADPASDIEGLALAGSRERARSRTAKELDDDF